MMVITRVALWIWGVKPNYVGHDIDENQNFLMVGNHLSYLDVVLYASKYPCLFVTSVEVRDSFGLGHICKLAGCVFVERRSRKGLGSEVSEITEALKNGLNVIVFPEATSTNGESVLRFKRPLFQAAINSGKPVLPIVLNYKYINNQPVRLSNRDQICWYGDMDFIPHFWNFLNLSSVEADVKTLPPITDTEILDITDLSVKAHDLVESEFQPFTA